MDRLLQRRCSSRIDCLLAFHCGKLDGVGDSVVCSTTTIAQRKIDFRALKLECWSVTTGGIAQIRANTSTNRAKIWLRLAVKSKPFNAFSIGRVLSPFGPCF